MHTRPAPVFNRKRQVKPGRPRSPGKWAGNRDGGNETLWDRERDGDGDPDFPLKSWKWINKATTWLWAQVRGHALALALAWLCRVVSVHTRHVLVLHSAQHSALSFSRRFLFALTITMSNDLQPELPLVSKLFANLNRGVLQVRSNKLKLWYGVSW